MPERFILLTSLSILTFFLLSGSRRSYYILPLIPGIMIIAGKTIRDWLDNPVSNILRHVLFITAIIFSFSGLALTYIYIFLQDFSHIS